MLLSDLLEISVAGNNLLKEIGDVSRGWELKINRILSKLNYSQQKIIRDNFKGLIDRGQLFDKLSEILVAHEFLKQEPIFFLDNSGKPDIWLKKINIYIEVKRINISDYQKNIYDSLQKSNFNLFDISNKLKLQEKMKMGLFKKTKEQINKAAEQLNKTERKGIIYLIYSLDLSGYIEDLATREKKFVRLIREWFEQKNKNKFLLKITNEKNLFHKNFIPYKTQLIKK